MSAGRSSHVATLLRTLGPLLGLVAAWLLFAALAGRNFMAIENQRIMLLQTCVVAAAAIGATFIIISGGIDLSVGSNIALGTMVIALLLRAECPPALAICGGLLSAMACGAAIGGMVVGRVIPVLACIAGFFLAAWLWPRWSVQIGPGLGAVAAIGVGAGTAGAGALAGRHTNLPLSPFIVTLGMWGALRGLAKGLGDNQPIYPASIGWLGELMSLRGTGWLGVPPAVWLIVVLALVASVTLRYTRFGRHVYAVGSNPATARLCGVRVAWTQFLVFTFGVGCAGISSVLRLSELSIGDPTTDNGTELKVIAAVVIGGASLSGGEGGIWGTLIGALLMTVVDNGCNKLGLSNWVQEIVTGGIILGAVLLDRIRARAHAAEL